MSEDRISSGAWWDPDTWSRARAAYLFDLDHNPQAPAGFIHWLHWVIERHIARAPRGRAELAIPARGLLPKSKGLTRHHPLRADTVEAMNEAILQDRAAKRIFSRSMWIHEAVTAAVNDAEQRAGGQLPSVPLGARLPNQPSKPGHGTASDTDLQADPSSEASRRA